MLDLEYTVGDIFDDRSPSGDIRTSIVKVARFPPHPSELRNPQRFFSTLPESSARPKKRQLEILVSQNREELPPMQSIENSSANCIRGTFGPATKRQRRPHVPLYGSENLGYPHTPQLTQDNQPQVSSQISGGQGSIHQVLDSQRSLARNGTSHDSNWEVVAKWLAEYAPYDTPTSLLLITPPGRAKSRRSDDVVPDSPTARKASAIDLDREDTKSESPEIRVSVHEVPPSTTAPAQRQGVIPETKPTLLSLDQLDPSQQQVPVVRNTEAQKAQALESRASIQRNQVQGDDERADEESANSRNEDGARPKGKPSHNMFGQGFCQTKVTQRAEAHIFDPIESDSDTFHTKQQLHCAKRLKLSTPLSVAATSKHTQESRLRNEDTHFLVPQNPCGEVRQSHIKDQTTLPVKHNAVSSSQQSKNQSKIDAVNANSQSNPPTLKEMADDGASDAGEPCPEPAMEQQPHQGSTSTLELSKSHTKALREHTRASGTPANLSGGRLQETRQANSHHTNESFAAFEAEQRTRRGSEQQPSTENGGRNAAGEEIQQDSFQGQPPSPEAAGTEKLMIRSGQKPAISIINNDHVTDKRTVENKLQKQKSSVSPISSRIAKAREQDLEKQAEKWILAADGARQLEVEKAKAKALPSSIVKPTASDTMKTPKHTKTEEQKVARKARDTKQKVAKNPDEAEVRKAQEQQSAFDRAQLLAKNNADQVKMAHTVDQTRSTSKMTGSDRTTSSPGVASSTSSRSGSIRDCARSTLTPALPHSLTKSPSLQLADGFSSSPLTSRSSGPMDPPLRSAMRQTPSSLRRSVSFINDKVVPGPSMSRTSSVSVVVPKINKPASSKASKSSEAERKVSSAKFDKTPLVKKEKVQMRLNVTRDDKMKGREIRNPPSPAKPPPKEELVISSDEDVSSVESYFSNEDLQRRSAKAGPSSRKKGIPASSKASSLAKPGLSTQPVDSASIDPALQNIRGSQDHIKAGGSTTNANTRHFLDTEPRTQQKSNSRMERQRSSDVVPSSSDASASESDSESEPKKDQQQKPKPLANGNPAPASNLRLGANRRTVITNAKVNGVATPSTTHNTKSSSEVPAMRSQTTLGHKVQQISDVDKAHSAPTSKQQATGRPIYGPTAVNHKFKYPSLTQLRSASMDTPVGVVGPPPNPVSSGTGSLKIPLSIAALEQDSSSSEESSSEDDVKVNSQSTPKLPRGWTGFAKRMLFFSSPCGLQLLIDR